jgi:hypothetical protein
MKKSFRASTGSIEQLRFSIVCLSESGFSIYIYVPIYSVAHTKNFVSAREEVREKQHGVVLKKRKNCHVKTEMMMTRREADISEHGEVRGGLRF